MLQPLSTKLSKETLVGQPCEHRNGVQQDNIKHAIWVEYPIGLRFPLLTGSYRSVFGKIMYPDFASHRLSERQDNMYPHHLELIRMWGRGWVPLHGGFFGE